jgi:hypothetical protein
VVYEIPLENPQPNETIAAIDLLSGQDDAGPFFLAISLNH